MGREEALDFLKRLAECIAIMFGDSCETLVHDMSVPSHPVLVIYNGHISGRDIGSTKDIYGNQSWDKGGNIGITQDYINHRVDTINGKKIKSSTIHMQGENYSYALGINYDYTRINEMNQFISNFIQVDKDLENAIEDKSQNKVEELMNQCITVIGKEVEQMNKRDRLQVIKMLKEKNAFTYQKSVPYVSERLQVSRCTIYKYIQEANGD